MKNYFIITSTVIAVSLTIFVVTQKPSEMVKDADRSVEKITVSERDTISHPHPSNESSNYHPSDSMHQGKIKNINAKIQALETQLEQSNSIARLNDMSASPDEREQIFNLLKNLDRLRTEALNIEVAKIEKEFAHLESTFPERLKALGGQP